MPLAYDFEVLEHDWLLVAIDLNTKKETIIHNDQNKMTEFYENHKTDIWIGFNSAHYDIYILKAIICGFNPKEVNDWIIIKDRYGWEFSDTFRKVPINNFDVFTGYNGLKTLEGFMGSSIEESSIPWDIDRPLTAEELSELITYCRHDVQETIKVFMHRLEEFTSTLGLIKMFNLPLYHINKSKAQLSAFILGARKTQYNDEMAFSIVDTLQIEKYKYIVDWYNNPENRDYKKFLITEVCGIPHKFSWGGLHGAPGEIIIKNGQAVDAKPIPYYGTGIYLHIDVNSYYPSIMLEYEYLSRSVPSDAKFREIRDLRIKYKKAHDSRANPLKIVINSTYGAMKDMTNPLYDPRQANNVCVGGQLLLLDLLEHLEGCCQVIQSNTDGIIVKIASEDDVSTVKGICQEWEKRTRMGLGYDFFDKIYQADVNNYLIANGEEYESKGCVKRPEILDNDLPIIRTAAMEYMLHGTDPKKTIHDCNDLMQFQQIVKVSKNFDFAVIYSKYGEEILNGKHFRVFASKNTRDGMIKRGKWENVTRNNLFGEMSIHKADKFASTPDHCFVDNGDVNGKPCPAKLDKDFYVKRAYDFLKRFGVEHP